MIIRMFFAIIFLVTIPITARLIYLGLDTGVAGFLDVSPILRGIGFLFLIIFGTALGVFGSLIFPRLIKRSDESLLQTLQDRHAVVGSCILAPLIVSGFYPDIAKIESNAIVFLLCFQNGYFWENVTSLLYKQR